MRVWPVFKKEMRLYFTSPVAWVVLTIFSFITGYFFYSIFAYFTLASMQSMMNPMMARELNVTDSVLRPLFSNISVILLLMMPLVTMRLFAEKVIPRIRGLWADEGWEHRWWPQGARQDTPVAPVGGE